MFQEDRVAAGEEVDVLEEDGGDGVTTRNVPQICRVQDGRKGKFCYVKKPDSSAICFKPAPFLQAFHLTQYQLVFSMC